MKTKPQLRRKADRLWSQAVFKKYGKKCICGKLATDPHHYIPKGRCSKLRYEVSNGVPLCKGCHIFGVHLGDPAIGKKIVALRGKKWEDKLVRIYKQSKKKTNNSFLTKKYYEKIIKKLEAYLKGGDTLR